MNVSHEVERMVCVQRGPSSGASPIPAEGKWIQAREVKDISGLKGSRLEMLDLDPARLFLQKGNPAFGMCMASINTAGLTDPEFRAP